MKHLIRIVEISCGVSSLTGESLEVDQRLSLDNKIAFCAKYIKTSPHHHGFAIYPESAKHLKFSNALHVGIAFETEYELAEAVGQLTYSVYNSGRHYFEGLGHCEFTVRDDTIDETLWNVTGVIGGYQKGRIFNILKYGNGLHHWAFDRLILNTKARAWQYVAGQEYRGELQHLRNYLYNL